VNVALASKLRQQTAPPDEVKPVTTQTLKFEFAIVITLPMKNTLIKK
jgi:hypothetical protein